MGKACWVGFALLVAGVGHGRPAGEVDDPHVALLAQHGIEPTAESLGNYLRSIAPPGDLAEHVAKFVSQLGSTDYPERETATRALPRLPYLREEDLSGSRKSSDPEVRWRAERILRELGTGQAVFISALRVITSKEIKGLAELLLPAARFSLRPDMQAWLDRALRTTATAADADFLSRAVASPDLPVRCAAITTWAAVAGQEAGPLLDRFLADPSEEVRLAAAIALAGQGSRDALPVLGKLLEAESIGVRRRSIQVLRALTGQPLDYAPYDEPESRAANARAWQIWIARNGAEASLQLPIPEGFLTLGRVLICDYGRARVFEINEKGKVLWEQALRHPWGCQGLPNGHRLVASFALGILVEYDAEGREVWKQDPPGKPSSVERLPNGHTLLACSEPDAILELALDGTVVWKREMQGRPFAAQRLDNGHTLVTLINAGRVVEINRDGEELWGVGGFSAPQNAQRLENGNTLIVDHGRRRLVEVNRPGEIVWTKELPSLPFDAWRLPDGSTLVALPDRVLLMGLAGEEVLWEKDGTFSRVHGGY